MKSEQKYASGISRHLALLILLAIGAVTYLQNSSVTLPATLAPQPKCQILDVVRPAKVDNATLVRIMTDAGFRNQSAAKLLGAVQVKTDTYDDSPLVADNPEYWAEKFGPFHEYLARTFPSAWSFLEVEKVNSWGLLLTWKGSDKSLKPIVLLAHQDVVPTQDATLHDWTYPPYDGVFDGEKLWGRGSADCKNLLVALLESAELLHENGFKPKRTIVYSFGFDEEIGGTNGANHLAKALLDRYGPDSIYAVVDEGGQSLIEEDDVWLALPGTGEKGSIDIVVGVSTPGGHSSVPPDHTSIGIISDFISKLEQNPFASIFTPKNPTFHEFQCIATHSTTLKPSLKEALLNADTDRNANKAAIEYLRSLSLTNRYLIGTSTAVDIIHGGAKSNALPEYVEAVVNHRVAIESTVQQTVDHDMKLIVQTAEKFGVGVIFNGIVIIPKTEKGYFVVSYTDSLEPAPLTPVGDRHWDVFGGVLRHMYEEIGFINREDNPFKTKPLVVAPGIATGNTDTKYYWDLTKHIYRYRPGVSPTVDTHAHGVDERIPFDSHLQIIAFYYEYLQVVDDEE